MEASALTYSGGTGLQARSPLLRLQSDERLISLTRRGSTGAFETLVSRYQARLLAFCRHLLGSREDAEDVLQEVFAAAFNAMLADDRPIAARPWLYRIARNRCLNHLRRVQPVAVESMDVHLSEHGSSAADKVHARENFRLLVKDIHHLPETQRSALVLREMAALSYEQIAQAMETTVPSVKSLLVRARLSLAEASEARQLGCQDVRLELAEVAEGLRRTGPLVRRHLRTCGRCSSFERELKRTNKALAAYLPLGSLALVRKLALFHLGHSAGAGSGAGGTAGAAGASGTAGVGATGTAGVGGATATATGTTAGVGGVAGATGTAGVTGVTAGATGVSTVAAGASSSLLTAGAGALATKAAATLAVAAIATAGAVATTHSKHSQPAAPTAPAVHSSSPATSAPSQAASQPVTSIAPPSTVSAATTTTAAAATTTTTAAATTTSATTTTNTSPPVQATTTTPAVAGTASDGSATGTPATGSTGTGSGTTTTGPGSSGGTSSGGTSPTGSTGGPGTTGPGGGSTGPGTGSPSGGPTAGSTSSTSGAPSADGPSNLSSGTPDRTAGASSLDPGAVDAASSSGA